MTDLRAVPLRYLAALHSVCHTRTLNALERKGIAAMDAFVTA